MTPAWQISRNGLLWVLLSFVAVIAQHVEHLPIWVSLSMLVVVVWRVQIYRGVWRYPRLPAKLALLAVCFAGLLLTYSRLTGLEPMTALLVSAFGLKMLEMHQRRDALVVIYLAYFIAALECLYFQKIVVATYVTLCLIVVTTALMAISQRAETSVWLPLRRSALMLAQAIPIMLLLFIVMPRLGSLWSVPTQQHAARTGVSDSMSPGDFSRLGRSAEVAFRARFEGQVPPHNQRYWRGLVLSSFDGRTWSQGVPFGYADGNVLQWVGDVQQTWAKKIEYIGIPWRYSVIIEPTFQPWLYALETPRPLTSQIALSRDLRLVYAKPVNTEMSYEVESWPDYQFNDELPPLRRAYELALPDRGNPQTRKTAQQWRQEYGSDDAFVQRVLGLFNREFTYTLTPPLLGENSVDEFLWGTKKGFCEHFSSSFTFMMRAAGIPARVVVGYQGGEYQAQAGYMVVRQYDAHAWSEVWLQGRGWVRVDPTTAVAPERIDTGLAANFSNEAAFASDQFFSLERFRGIPLLNLLRLKLDELDYAWAVWVLGYDDKQMNFLGSILGDVNPKRIAIFMAIVGSIIMLALSLTTVGRQRMVKRDPAVQLWLNLCQRLERSGAKRETGEAIRHYLERVGKLSERHSNELRQLAASFEAHFYDGENPTSLAELRLQVRRLRI